VPACSAPHSGREVQRRLGPPCVAATVVNESSLADPRAPGCCAGRRCPRISISPRRRLPAWTARVRPSRPLVVDGLLRCPALSQAAAAVQTVQLSRPGWPACRARTDLLLPLIILLALGRPASLLVCRSLPAGPAADSWAPRLRT
jgi:hypothetical protein